METNKDQLKQKISELEGKLRMNPEDRTAQFFLGHTHIELENYKEASDILYDLVRFKPEQVVAYNMAAKAAIFAGHHDRAEEAIETGLKRFPKDAELFINKAALLQSTGRIEEAEKVLEKLSEIYPDHESLASAWGAFYAHTGRKADSLELLLDDLEKNPNDVMKLNLVGFLFSEFGDHIQATEYYIRALRIDPQNLNVLSNIGNAFQVQNETELAIQFLDEGLKIDPDYGPIVCAKASILANHGFSQEMMPEYERGLAQIRKDDTIKISQYMAHKSNYVFYMHYAPGVPRQKIYDEILDWQKKLCADIEEKPAVEFENKTDRGRKLRLGLISTGFKIHPVGQMIIAALKNLNRDAFEIYSYFDAEEKENDFIVDAIKGLSDRVHSSMHIDNHFLVEQIRDDNIDILIEMTGHAEGGKRLPLVAHRVAPVQVKWVGGLFNTSGIPQMDWLITDHVETPEGDDKWYTEKLYRMPDDYIVYNPPFYAPKVKSLPAKENGFITFGNLNNPAKTNSYSIKMWSKILKEVPNSKLMLKSRKFMEEFVQKHLYESFAKNGIEADRLIIEGGEKHQQFLNVYNRIDIALDPHPYTGGLTTCEAIWMGVPVVTLPGETFAGRHAATHLTNADLSQFIAKDEQDYIDIAVRWAKDIEGLEKLRSGLREHVSKTPLVDGPKFAKNLEVGLRHMWAEWCDMKEEADKPPVISKPKPKAKRKKK